MDADRLLTMLYDECARSPEGRANRASIERRFEDAFLTLMNQNCIAKNGLANTISLLPAGPEKAKTMNP